MVCINNTNWFKFSSKTPDNYCHPKFNLPQTSPDTFILLARNLIYPCRYKARTVYDQSPLNKPSITCNSFQNACDLNCIYSVNFISTISLCKLMESHFLSMQLRDQTGSRVVIDSSQCYSKFGSNKP